MAHTGRCLCGQVTVSIESEPLGARTCWCRDCQKFGGGNGTTNAFFAFASVSTQGELTWYESTADSGNTTRRAFCPACGSHIFTRSSAAPDFGGVRLGVFDDKDLIAPQAVIWTDSAPDWAYLDPDLPHFPKAPPVPSVDPSR
ncbi:GFA family protein [Altererythrobacter arenosus]|uniref:GFA family protein n=1 Tax=Altererythrobacter arenosus TaxID=3032592 RepID=A0ABY8FUE9_9SPHN|nr:GFA family protein [Altererythrobacter sp. CAU 1644]WFL77026.1 GFA family protein [Altererythrobacter sp. CAU 1644]